MISRDDTITLHGRRVRLLRGGSGIPLLYLHDTFVVGAVWGTLHDRLAEHYEVFLPIHPGCDGSEVGDIDTMDDMVFHYLDLCQALQIEHPVVIGASLGGWVAAELAVRYAPLLRSLILLDALGLRLEGVQSADVLRLDPAQTRAALFAAPAAPLAQQLVPDMPVQESFAAYLQARQTLARFAWQFPDNPRLSRYLYRITLPTLILWGAQDGFVPPAFAQGYQAGIAGARLTLLPQCGHLPHVEQPEACVQAIADFLHSQG